MHLLFWLSLVPFVTGWMGENHFAPMTTAVYGGVLLMAAIAYYILEVCIFRHEGEGSRLKQSVGGEVKGKVSILLYVCAIGFSFFAHWVGVAIYAAVALMWLVPDRRIERNLA
jgi:uncharacterized membrane protein